MRMKESRKERMMLREAHEAKEMNAQGRRSFTPARRTIKQNRQNTLPSGDDGSSILMTTFSNG